MGGTEMTDDLLTSALPGVPWVSFFHEDGYSCHGTYWHDNFGLRMSHGCINMRTDQALWLYRWTEPTVPYSERQVSGWGTRIRVME
jgi:lipoprotein-anchoring transpeptidase ErfK/SrfK